ncbi:MULTISPECIES: IS66 family insertion sequence element accessory protein TnpB [unclassified Mesorhizobium]|uniref:IS66 family insertion sequence element accessory protein TnpB n=1 Tax=Mesorhizobium sp. TaxID=1871066 RepID=UPI000F754B87|nr:IS66 family insertion sequence hypothetical protein [Mesorhizobium sp. M2A.F.Ca.ET.043.05.1.1]RVB72053.1 IS66 family insertion sequence hypothetical protein [Mesorhizobium sp. M6A.T.Cr.TU.014.01.1.1]RWP97806.1 MAG: IS66 family insertion sequence hypothetical protein [Mesorhizobium sp.]RWP98722.1 MAG: IS66 family insertion sequence hypothetical protein [Mesorhizobium sp.]
MIGPGTGVRVYLACGFTMPKGIEGLVALTQDVLRPEADGRRGLRLWGKAWRPFEASLFYGQGSSLYYKVLQKGRFPWPSAADGTARLTSAQMAMLWEGIDWRRPKWGAPQARVG